MSWLQKYCIKVVKSAWEETGIFPEAGRFRSKRVHFLRICDCPIVINKMIFCILFWVVKTQSFCQNLGLPMHLPEFGDMITESAFNW